MKILAVDTATLYGGVAVYDDEEGSLSEHRVGGQTRQFSESLMEMIDLCLKNLSFSIKDIDCFAVTSGPGSFTGLRVGLSTVKGLAFATSKPVVTVSTLFNHAMMFPFIDDDICPVLDARKKEVYSAIYRWNDGSLITVLEEGVFSIEELLRSIDRKTVFIGDGIKVYGDRVRDALKDNARFAPASMYGGLPSTLARIAIQKARNNEFTDLSTFSPKYFRRSEAELKS